MSLSAFDFHTLMPDLILDALESVGLRVDSGLTELNSYENRVYQFMDEDRQRYVVKFYRPERWSHEQIQEEHDFTQALSDTEIPAVAPLRLNQRTLHDFQGFMFTVFPSVGGRQYEVDNLDQLEWVARFLGRIHQVGKHKPFVARPTIGLDEYLYQPRQTLAESALVPESVKKSLMPVLDDLIQGVEQYWHTNWAPSRLHGDCHPGNILWRDGPMFVDLDDARNGPVVQDIWMLLQGDRQEQLMQLDLFVESYSEFADFDQKELALIEPLRCMRMVYYLAWVVRRWQDPAFPKSFPWIADIDFWQQQPSLFTEQVKLLQAPPLQLTPMY
ncbi:serine/threonine protein kinase [Pragia fontium]|uniref:Stress response kinase A n=2 Tax=Pragia fontium TaxID=82985 RepID=A0AAJ4WCE8_9GAMM|nr:serine/threonine protein kinase [Pragia fontium]AKJ43612.1 serine/threonine protein kinase [Pragia fontium]SFD20495.1 Ser/Thr protein kinase RdoA involved in Cpx stress response, MazF antagonist [Pragia fontium DSM 5563 = ATCC 49100]SUB84108.1 serine/threonine protein kinase [Pragia fontium]VEJ57000.1 serine/threonine protein kinase [Pragia fontium]GKX64312.1 stress response kinase A [Pragia fontium]